MKPEEFKTYIKFWICENTIDDAIFKTDYFTDSCIEEAGKEEADGDFVFENELFAVGKFYHSIKLNCDITKSADVKTINYIVFGIGYKDDEGELIDYDEFDYMIL